MTNQECTICGKTLEEDELNDNICGNCLSTVDDEDEDEDENEEDT